MGEQVARGVEFEVKAEKKLKGWSIFGNKYEDAIGLYERAANCYKLSKSWDKAGAVYLNLAKCHEKLESKHESAAAHVDAANCYKKTNPQEAVKCLSVAVLLFMEIGRLSMAAKHSKDIAEIYEQEADLENSMDNYEKAFELYQGEDATSTGNQCRLKVAQFAAQLKQYPKAIEIFEAVARQSMDNNLLKYSVKGYLLNAGLCYICIGDIISVTNAVERYQEIDPSFSGSRESKLLTDLAAAMEEEDVDKFTDVVREFDSMIRLDQWKTTLLLCAKEKLKEKVDQVDFT